MKAAIVLKIAFAEEHSKEAVRLAFNRSASSPASVPKRKGAGDLGSHLRVWMISMHVWGNCSPRRPD